MKVRVKIDTFILLAVIAVGFFSCVRYKIFTDSVYVDDALDFLGYLLIFKGIFLRMAARGFKKANSRMGQGLVVSGPYIITRNPMYLGSFLLGCGFTLIVWPWWILPIFAVAFYLRFNRQMVKEEAHLKNLFGRDYEEYTRKTPRFFPNIKTVLLANVKNVFPLSYIWATKEKWGLAGWPVLGAFLDYFQESMVFGKVDPLRVGSLFALAVFTCLLMAVVEYNRG